MYAGKNILATRQKRQTRTTWPHSLEFKAFESKAFKSKALVFKILYAGLLNARHLCARIFNARMLIAKLYKTLVTKTDAFDKIPFWLPEYS